MTQLPTAEANHLFTELEKVRNALNDTRKTGVLNQSILADLNQLTDLNQTLLTELLPYFRLTDTYKKQVTIDINVLKAYGHTNSFSMVQKIFPIAEHSFLIQYFSGKIQAVKLCLETYEIIAYPIINPSSVTFTTVMDNGDYFLFLDKTAHSYTITKQELLNAEITQQKPILKRQGTSPAFQDNQWLIKLNHSTCLSINTSGKIDLVSLHTLLHPTILDTKQLTHNQVWLTMCQLNPQTVFLGNDQGDVACFYYQQGQLRLRKIISCFNGPVQKLVPLISAHHQTRQLAVLGQDGHWLIIFPDLSIQSMDRLQGRLFEGSVTKSLGIFLSDNGYAYLLEENFNHWEINPYVTKTDLWATSITPIDPTHYLIQDIDNSFQLLQLETLLTAEDLQHFNPYSRKSDGTNGYIN